MHLARAIALGVIMTLVVVAPAAAQGVTPYKVSVTFGVGQVNPLPFYLPFTAPTWTAGIEFAVAKHVVIEGVVGGYRHRDLSSYALQFDDRDGNLFDFIETLDERTNTFAARVNVVATASLGRVRLSSGAGVGSTSFSQQVTQEFSGCPPSLCTPFIYSYRANLFSSEFLLGADLTLTSRLRVFFTYRLSQPFREELGDVSLLTGVKIGIR